MLKNTNSKMVDDIRFIRKGVNMEGKSIFFKINVCFLDLILFVGLIFSVYIIIFPESIDTQFVMKIYGILAIIMLVNTFLVKNITLLGPAHILILYTLLSCFGYDILVLIDGDSYFDLISSIRHAYTDYFNLANALCYLAVLALIYGVRSQAKIKNIDLSDMKANLTFNPFERYLYLKVCYIIVILYTLILLFNVVSGRMPLTIYTDVREWFSTQPLLSYLLRLTWVAIPTYFFFAESKTEYISFLLPLSVMFLILMFSGNRNEILYPAAVAIGVFMWKRNRFYGKKTLHKGIVIVSIIIVFVINPLISNTRSTGLTLSDFAVEFTAGAFGFEAALLELGQQLNPISIILYALDNHITSYQYGLTFIVPTVSILSLNFIWGTSFYNNSTYYNPTRLLNSLGHYGRGFSYIAEFYYNFGVIGMIICMFCIGRYIGKRENSTLIKRKVLFYFQVMPLFMVFSRNIFGFSILIPIFAMLLNLFVSLLSQRRSGGAL